MFSWENTYKSFVNLDHRLDRLSHMMVELDRIGIKAERTRGMYPSEFDPNDPKLKVQWNRTPGSIGCHASQVSIMKKALEKNQDAGVMEDDLIFCSDFMKRIPIIENFLDEQEWDVFWLGGTYHIQPEWHVKGHYQLPDCNCDLNRDWEKTGNPYIVRTYGCWSTYAYIVNVNSIEKILKLFDLNIHKSIGIDYLFILLQPLLRTYAFVPGCVKQMDNQSDIGTGITKFSGFSNLGSHWWSDKM